MTNETTRNWKPATAMVHGGTLRSQFGETSEAMYLTQGFVYESSEAAEARFKGEHARLHLLALRQPHRRHVREAHVPAGRRGGRARDGIRHGRGVGRATLQRSAPATTWSLHARFFGSCRWVVETLMPKYGVEVTLVDGRYEAEWGKGRAAQHEALLPRKPDKSDARGGRHRRCRQDRQRHRRARRGGQRVRHAAAAEAARTRAHTWSSTPPQSTSTDRAASWAA
jgi:hypothetical protein